MATPTYTRAQWANDVLSKLGNSPSALDVVPVPFGPGARDYTAWWLAAWTMFESAPGEKGYNLLKTCQPEPGSTTIPGGSCVQSYQQYSDSINATVAALQNGRYPALLHALQTNDLTGLGMQSILAGLGLQPTSGASNVASEVKVWNGGANYSVLNIATRALDPNFENAGGLSDQTFPDTAGSANNYSNSAQSGNQANNPASDIMGGTCNAWDITCIVGNAISGLSGTIHSALVRIGFFILGLILFAFGGWLLIQKSGAVSPSVKERIS